MLTFESSRSANVTTNRHRLQFPNPVCLRAPRASGAPADHPLLPEKDSEAEKVEQAALKGSQAEAPATPPDLLSPTESRRTKRRYEFLRRRHQLEPDGSITIRAATRLFYQDLYELAGRPKRKSPGPQWQGGHVRHRRHQGP